MSYSGWIRIYRKITQNGVYRDSYAVHLLLHLLLTANKEGMAKVSLRQLSKDLGMSPAIARRRLDKLRSNDIISCTPSRDGTEVTILNFVTYQQPKDEQPKEQPSEPPQQPQEPHSPHKNRSQCFRPPSVAMVAEYCQQRGNGIDPQAFVDFYISKGWMIGKNKMKDWKAAVRTWEQKRKKDGTYKQTASQYQYQEGAKAIQALLQRGAKKHGFEI